MTHTPTPWHVDQTCIEHHCCHSSAIMADDGEGRLLVSEVCTDQDSSHIVKCVNAHDDLVAALKAVLDFGLDDFQDTAETIAVYKKIESALAKAGAL